MTGVILANTGSSASPEPDDIEAYLREFLMDDRIRQLPKPLWKYLVFRKILPKRKYSSSERYRFIWTEEGSPLVVIQQRLAEKVQALFDAEADTGGAGELHVIVRSAMSYGSPSLENTLNEFRELGIEHVVLLPLYPQSAYSPTMAVVDAFWRAQDTIGWHPSSTVIDNYHDNPYYIAAIARALRNAGYGTQESDRILLSLHAIPLKDETAGDTYRTQVAASAKLIAEKLGIEPERITIAYQSVFGKDESKWASPLSLNVLRSWADDDFRVFFACPGFAVDCLETLYDIPHEMVPALEGEGAKPVVESVRGNIQEACNTSGRFVWIPTLNDSDEHAALIKNVLDEHINPAPHAFSA